MTKITDAVAAWRKVQADFKAHNEEAKRLKELEVVARHTGGDVAAAEAAAKDYGHYQGAWYELYCAERDATARILRELGFDKAEVYAFKNSIRT